MREVKIIDPRQFASMERPGRVLLQVGTCAIHLLKRITDSRGSLIAGEAPADLPFKPERFFSVFGVPSKELRGEHAHRKCEQFLVCLTGSCVVLLDDGQNRCEVFLDKPDVGIYMPPMIWGTQLEYSPDATLLVLASRPYEAEDYIRTYEEFHNTVRASRKL